jgi:hypothetical protein
VAIPKEILKEQLAAINRLKAPASVTRRLLAYLHSGEAVRHALPRFLRIGIALWLFMYAVTWLLMWPTVYREFERWGLVKAFFAQMVALLTALVVVQITRLRASHLEAFPADDFVVLRAMSVMCRWLGEVAMVSVVGMGISAFLQPVIPVLLFGLAADDGVGKTLVSLASGAVAVLFIVSAVPIFLLLYSIATMIDLGMAVEFNTREERGSTVELARALG